MASPQILTARELGELSLRWVNAPEPIAWGQKVPYSVHQEYSNGPASVLGIVIPGFFRHTDPFLGLVVISLAAMAGWKKKTVRLLLALAAWGLFCSLGSAFFLHGVLYSVLPYLNMARNPSMAIAVFHLGAIGLAAFGLDACRAAPESCRKLVWPLAVLSAVLYAGLALRGQEYYHLAMSALAALVLACVYAAWSRSAIGNGWACGLLILLMLVELGNVSTAGYQPLAKPLFVDKLYQNQDIARYLRTRGEPVRVSVDSEDIPYNFGDWFGVDEAGGNQPGALRAIITALPDPAMQRLLSVNYRIGHASAGARGPSTSADVFFQSGLRGCRDGLPRHGDRERCLVSGMESRSGRPTHPHRPRLRHDPRSGRGKREPSPEHDLPAGHALRRSLPGPARAADLWGNELCGMVGAQRFELWTSWSRTRRSTRLSHAPTFLV